MQIPKDATGLRNYRLTLFHVDDAARKIFYQPLLIDRPALQDGETNREPGRCIALEPSSLMGRPDYKGRQSLLVKTEGGAYRGLGWVGDARQGYRWAPVFEARDGSRVEFDREAAVAAGSRENAPYLRSWAHQAIYCISSDGYYVLTWEKDQPPQAVALPWFPIKSQSETRWAVADVWLRPPLATGRDSEKWLVGSWQPFFDRIKAQAPSGISDLTSNGKTLFLLGDDDSRPAAGIQLMQGTMVACASLPQVDPAQPPELVCDKTPTENGERCTAEAQHLGRDVTIEIWRSASDRGTAACQMADEICNHSVRIFDTDTANRGDRIPWLSVDNHVSMPIHRAGIPIEGELWLIDRAGQAWMFDIGLAAPTSWATTISTRAVEGWEKSRACQERLCETWDDKPMTWWERLRNWFR